MHNAVLYSGLRHCHIYTLSEYIYGLFVNAGAPSLKAPDGVREIHLDALAKAELREAKHIVREALYSLTDTIKFGANFYRMA